MSHPEIAIHKTIVMKENEQNQYLKRTQKDYSTALKLDVVQEIERGELSTHGAMRKYGIQSRSTIVGWLRKFGTFTNKCPSNRGGS
jgi:transposase-like protein